MSNLIKVALNLPIYQTFDYIIPKNLDKIDSGMRVEVMFGKKKMFGITIPSNFNTDKKNIRPKYKLREILGVMDKHPIIDKEIMDYYQYPIGQVLFGSIPSKLRKGGNLEIKESRIYIFSVLNKVNAEYFKNKPIQKKIYNYIINNTKVFLDDIKKITKNLNPLQKLIDEGIIEKVEFKDKNNPTLSKIDLNEEQLNVYKAITSNIDSFGSYLLEGATGSGKTELYIKTSELIISRKGQVLIIVPEINLTPQTLDRFQKYLKFTVKS